ncbi:ComEC/Rec2 family competence protein [Treponema endosymbiont of Eucomonympha sp.]|uniref:ComEC/Rec2 family competence protein n=1 Tax=Treponema endosymbiont of Eucomonympha sp. TaxID=1580831 RepID=UPI000751A809|nr:ComEC/Rec2 family competence protein [Treponema endosymbiont of Eucomonympha sp.]
MSTRCVCAAALLFAALIYGGVLPRTHKRRFASLLPPHAITGVSGKALSAPAKTRSGAYRLALDLRSVSGRLGAFAADSEARGRITVFIPAALYEAPLPGRLYSRNRSAQAPVVDSGVSLAFAGKMSAANTANGAADMPVFFADSAEYAETRHDGTGRLPSGERLARFRAACRLEFKRVLYAWGDAGGLFLALAAGTAEYVDPDVSDAFRKAGLAHVLALSGMHLSVFSGFTRRLTKRGGRAVSGCASFLFITLFVWFAGFSPSLRRAFIGFALAAAARFCGKRIDARAGLAACFVLHALLAPEDVFALSFILSYGGLAGILVFGEALRLPLCRLRVFPGAEGISASAGAALGTAPISAFRWGCVAPGGFVASAAVSPLVSFFLIAGAVCVALSLAAPFLLFPLGAIMRLMYRAIICVTGAFAQIPQVFIAGLPL